MNPTTISDDMEISLLCRRVVRLERENKKLKRIALAFGLGALGLFTMGQARQVPNVAPKVIEAEKFVLKDINGREKATLSMTKVGPRLQLHDVDMANWSRSMSIGAYSMEMIGAGEGKELRMFVSAGGLSFETSGKEGGDRIDIFAAGPRIELSDKQGFQTIVGVANLESPKTGETHKTSAASLVIFDKDKTVIWKAPIK